METIYTKIVNDIFKQVNTDIIFLKIGEGQFQIISKNEPMNPDILDIIKKDTDLKVYILDENKRLLREKYKLVKTDEKFINELIQDTCDITKSKPCFKQDFVIKSDVENKKNQNEIEIYKRVINPLIQNLVIPNFVYMYSYGTYSTDNRSWFILEKTTHGNLIEYINNNNVNLQTFKSLICQSLHVYFFLINLDYCHNDFKPQNLVIETDKNIRTIQLTFNLEKNIHVYDNAVVKLIDFAITKNKRQINITLCGKTDLTRFFEMLQKEIKNVRYKEAINYEEVFSSIKSINDKESLNDFLKEMISNLL